MVNERSQAKREYVLKITEKILQDLENSSEAEKEALMIQLGVPPPDVTARLEWLRNWRAESKAGSMTKVV